jgi:hypothetical protein
MDAGALLFGFQSNIGVFPGKSPYPQSATASLNTRNGSYDAPELSNVRIAVAVLGKNGTVKMSPAIFLICIPQ